METYQIKQVILAVLAVSALIFALKSIWKIIRKAEKESNYLKDI
jgi:hypothetical protein